MIVGKIHGTRNIIYQQVKNTLLNNQEGNDIFRVGEITILALVHNDIEKIQLVSEM